MKLMSIASARKMFRHLIEARSRWDGLDMRFSLIADD